MTLVGRVVTAVAGRTAARSVGGVAAGPAGLVLGATLPMLARRLGPMGMVGVAVGAWAVNRIIAKRAASLPMQSAPAAKADQITSARSPVTS